MRFRLVELDPRQAFQPVAIRHANIQQHQIRSVLYGEFERRSTTCRFADNANVGAREQCFDASADNFVVVGDDNSYSHFNLLKTRFNLGAICTRSIARAGLDVHQSRLGNALKKLRPRYQGLAARRRKHRTIRAGMR
jgi:hypothetical protein